MRPSLWNLFRGHMPQPSVWSPCSVLIPRVHSPHSGQEVLKNTRRSQCTQISNTLLPSHHYPYQGPPLLTSSGFCPIPIHILGPSFEQGACFKLLLLAGVPSGLSTSTWETPSPHCPHPHPLHLGLLACQIPGVNCLLKEGP